MAGYGSDDAFADWLAGNGYALPDGAPSAAVLRQRGSDYLDGLYGPRFPGRPTAGATQERAWPRMGASTIYGEAIPSDIVPGAVEKASYFAAYQEATSPGSLSVSVSGSARVKREKVGSLETEYFEPTGTAVADSTLVLSTVDGLLAPLVGPPDFPAVFVV